jgi:hypothetical protein
MVFGKVMADTVIDFGFSTKIAMLQLQEKVKRVGTNFLWNGGRKMTSCASTDGKKDVVLKMATW